MDLDLAFLARTSYERTTTQLEEVNLMLEQNVGPLLPVAKKLKNDLIANKEIAEKITKGIDESEAVNLEEIKKLRETEDRLTEEIKSLKEEIKSLKEEIKSLNEKIEQDKDDHQKQVACLKKVVFEKNAEITQNKMELKEIQSVLHTGQIAFDFEKDLATYIYPHDKKIGSRKIFTSMKRWLEEKKDTSQGREANEKWRALQNEFSWSTEHERVFFKLLEFRKHVAHPIVDRDKVQLQISNDFTDEEKVLVKDIVKMTDRVNELMQ